VSATRYRRQDGTRSSGMHLARPWARETATSCRQLWSLGARHWTSRAAAAAVAGGSTEGSVPDLHEYRYLFRYMTWDMRSKRLNDVLRRMQLLIRAAGGELHGGVASPSDKLERIAVLRSPFVDKSSQEHFERVTRFRVLRWTWRADTQSSVASKSNEHQPVDMGHAVAMETPAGYGLRVTETRNGLAALAFFFTDIVDSQHKLGSNGHAAGVDAAPRAAGVVEARESSHERGNAIPGAWSREAHTVA
jgi:ribosomal protein S10